MNDNKTDEASTITIQVETDEQQSARSAAERQAALTARDNKRIGLEAERDTIRKELESLNREMARMQERKNELNARADFLNGEIEPLLPLTGEHIEAYLAQSKKTMAEKHELRVAARARLLEAGLTPEDVRQAVGTLK